jgi:spore coat protein CotH
MKTVKMTVETTIEKTVENMQEVMEIGLRKLRQGMGKEELKKIYSKYPNLIKWYNKKKWYKEKQFYTNIHKDSEKLLQEFKNL